MTVSIIYHTRFGNNARIADLLSDSLESKGYGVSIHPVSEAEPSEIPSSDLYIIGSPTQLGTIPVKMDRFLKHMKISDGSRYAVYSTYAQPGSKTTGEITGIMNNLGAVPAVDPLVLSVKYVKGPLEGEWEVKASRWSETL